MTRGLALHDITNKNYQHNKFPSITSIKHSIEDTLYSLDYEKGQPLNGNNGTSEANIFPYYAKEGVCIVRFGNEKKEEFIKDKLTPLNCYDQKGTNHLVRAILTFIRVPDKLVQDTKKAFERTDFPSFEF